MNYSRLFKVLALILVVVAGVVVVPSVQAGRLKSLTVTPSDTRPGQTGVAHDFLFTLSTGNVTQIIIQYCETASGTCTTKTNGGNQPNVESSVLANEAEEMDAAWTLSSASAFASGDAKVILRLPSGTDGSANDQFRFSLTGITNHTLGGCNPTDTGTVSNSTSDTCYVRVSTHTSAASADPTVALADSSTASVTVVTEITVSATVDPSFTFVVGAVNSGVVNNQITTSVSSTYSTLPFGNLTVATPKYAAHSLTVTTNTQNGYTVTARMRSAMTGTYGGDIDPFPAAWGTSTTWTQPWGETVNENTAWIGANTTDSSGLSNAPNANGKFGKISSSAVTVSQEADSDPGNAVYVTYGVEANAYHPADTYTGYLVYTAVPTY